MGFIKSTLSFIDVKLLAAYHFLASKAKQATVLALVALSLYLLPSGSPRYDYYTADNLPKIQATRDPASPFKKPSILHLEDKNGDFFCTGFVIDRHYAATAAHCVRDKVGDKIIIKDQTGNDTGIRATVGALNARVDYAVLLGDFSGFNAIAIETDEPRAAYSDPKIPLVACGFPEGQRHLVCVPFFQRGPAGFSVLGIGAALYPGMSGGPVIDTTTMKVVGINSAMSGQDSYAIIAPTVGLYGAFNIEPNGVSN